MNETRPRRVSWSTTPVSTSTGSCPSPSASGPARGCCSSAAGSWRRVARTCWSHSASASGATSISTSSLPLRSPSVRVSRSIGCRPPIRDCWTSTSKPICSLCRHMAGWPRGVVLEARACGTAVLPAPLGGIPDMLEDGRAGALVSYGDVRALRDALEGLLANPELLASLGARARERCETHYDARKQFVRLTEHLREARSRFAAHRG